MRCNAKSLTRNGAETGSGPNARVSKTADLLVADDVSATCSPTGFEERVTGGRVGCLREMSAEKAIDRWARL